MTCSSCLRVIFSRLLLTRTKYGQVMKSTTLRLPDAFAGSLRRSRREAVFANCSQRRQVAKSRTASQFWELGSSPGLPSIVTGQKTGIPTLLPVVGKPEVRAEQRVVQEVEVPLALQMRAPYPDAGFAASLAGEVEGMETSKRARRRSWIRPKTDLSHRLLYSGGQGVTLSGIRRA